MRTDTDPAAELNEAVQAALFTRHPYGTPIIGWGHEIAGLDRDDALAYYRRFYTPENAILVVAGDVESDEVLRLARDTYGRIPARGEAPRRSRPQEPAPRAQKQVRLADEKVEQPSFQRVHIVPSYTTAKPGEAEALEVLAHCLGGGQTSLLYRSLVVERRLAVAAGAYYLGTALDDTRFWIYAVPAEGVTLETLDDAVEDVVGALRRDGVDAEDLRRARTRLVADAIYAQDNQASLARWYGAALATGGTIDDLKRWPAQIDAVTAEAVRTAATLLDRRRGVSGFLVADTTGDDGRAAA